LRFIQINAIKSYDITLNRHLMWSLKMGDNGFRDLDHVDSWLKQFSKPDISSSTHEATIQMVALLAQALQVVVAEVQDLKSRT